MARPDSPSGIPPRTLAQLRALDIASGRPLIAVDVDDCLAVFVDHLHRYIGTLGYEMRLERYELEGSIFQVGSDAALPFDECIGLIHRFFENECARQEAVPGGAEALRRLEGDAQIVILTNVPEFAGAARRRNLAALGIPWPVVVNTGGKGRAMAWLARAAGAPSAFVDDSVRQIENVAKHAPEVIRLHFAGAEFIRRLFPECAAATCQVHDWHEAERVLRVELRLGEGRG